MQSINLRSISHTWIQVIRNNLLLQLLGTVSIWIRVRIKKMIKRQQFPLLGRHWLCADDLRVISARMMSAHWFFMVFTRQNAFSSANCPPNMTCSHKKPLLSLSDVPLPAFCWRVWTLHHQPWWVIMNCLSQVSLVLALQCRRRYCLTVFPSRVAATNQTCSWPCARNNEAVPSRLLE